MVAGLMNPALNKDFLIDNFTRNHREYMPYIQSQFMLQMTKKKFGFVLSGKLWDEMTEIWEECNSSAHPKPDTYFSVSTTVFDKHLAELHGGYFENNNSEVIALLWGSVYIYDFLLSIGLISQKVHNDFKKTTKELKGLIIHSFISALWNSNFVHYWEKPDSISDNEFNEEAKIFQKNFAFNIVDFSKIKPEIEDELKNIGELSEYIHQASTISIIQNDKIAERYFQGLGFETEIDERALPQQNIVPVRTEPKIGRNDLCLCGSGKKHKKCCGK